MFFFKGSVSQDFWPLFYMILSFNPSGHEQDEVSYGSATLAESTNFFLLSKILVSRQCGIKLLIFANNFSPFFANFKLSNTVHFVQYICSRVQ